MQPAFLSLRRWIVCALSALFFSTLDAAEAIEIGPSNTALLPQGKEADGIIGDFVMRNDLVELTISHGAPNRRANMSTFYGTNGATPGCLYDLGLRGAHQRSPPATRTGLLRSFQHP